MKWHFFSFSVIINLPKCALLRGVGWSVVICRLVRMLIAHYVDADRKSLCFWPPASPIRRPPAVCYSGLGVASSYAAKKMSRDHVRRSDVTNSGELPYVFVLRTRAHAEVRQSVVGLKILRCQQVKRSREMWFTCREETKEWWRVIRSCNSTHWIAIFVHTVKDHLNFA